MDTHEEHIYQLVLSTRRLFQQLRTVSDELLEDTGINASQRAVLEFLMENQPQTVSGMAREKSVSRQHIQILVNDLSALKLIKLQDNPAHKRSPLITITEQGKNLFKKIVRKESKILEILADKFSEKDIAVSIRTLNSLSDYLRSTKWNK